MIGRMVQAHAREVTMERTNRHGRQCRTRRNVMALCHDRVRELPDPSAHADVRAGRIDVASPFPSAEALGYWNQTLTAGPVEMQAWTDDRGQPNSCALPARVRTASHQRRTTQPLSRHTD